MDERTKNRMVEDIAHSLYGKSGTEEIIKTRELLYEWCREWKGLKKEKKKIIEIETKEAEEVFEWVTYCILSITNQLCIKNDPGCISKMATKTVRHYLKDKKMPRRELRRKIREDIEFRFIVHTIMEAQHNENIDFLIGLRKFIRGYNMASDLKRRKPEDS